jgi:hypothetical protein
MMGRSWGSVTYYLLQINAQYVIVGFTSLTQLLGTMTKK